MRFILPLAFNFLLTASTLQAAPSVSVHMCIDEKPSFFFYNKTGTEKSEYPGFVFDLISYLQTRLNLDIKVTRRPQHACYILLEKGEVDAVALLSHNPHRERLGLYPMKNGEPDADRAVIRTSYFLYTTKERPITWDGKDLTGLKGKRLGAMEGFSIVHDLEQTGVKVETFKSLHGMITRLQKNDIDAIAAHNDMIKRISERIQLQKHEQPLKTKDYFIQVSRLFKEKHPSLPNTIWKESAHFLKSPEGHAAISKYEKLESFP